eukprot:m.62851 g.62851  ORF g.62851 m.62851 type:complete len:325 (-) comp11928_c0_seq4:3435-4409(-)
MMALSRLVNGVRQLGRSMPRIRAMQRASMASVSSTSDMTKGSQDVVLSEDEVAFFNQNGYLILEQFTSKDDCQKLMQACTQLVTDYDPKEEQLSIFRTTNQETNSYFLESGDKIRYFHEDGSVDREGNLIVDPAIAFNKIGHGLHIHNPTFRDFSFAPRMATIARQLGMRAPVVPQSMYIFKNPGIGGEVVAHQDSTFLYTTPLSVIGFWTALHDCTLTNGCLEVIPGSHLDGVHNNRRMVLYTNEHGVLDTKFTADPQEYPDEAFIPAVIPAGSLFLIHGSVVHRSQPNTSDRPRHAYVFHAVDDDATYAPENWLQSPPFPAL